MPLVRVFPLFTAVRYTLTAVSEAGERTVAQFLEAGHYTQMIEEWRVATSRALLQVK